MPTFLPTTLQEAGGAPPDVVLVTGDAYVDDPSFGPAVVGRWLQAHGFTVGIIAQPRWDTPEDFRILGRPRLFYGVTAGNLDSMVAGYTSAGRRRNDDAYTPGGRSGARPDRATIAYTARCRQAFPGVPVILGGVEASLRRHAHYDWWQDRIRRSVLLDAKADGLVFGMGEQAVLALALRLDAGASLEACRDLPGTAWVLPGGAEVPPGQALPPFEDLSRDRDLLGAATRLAWTEANPENARPLLQRHGDRILLVNPPAPPLPPEALDQLHELPFARAPHPGYREPVPAFEAIRGSVTVVRGCGGGCAFCALGLHQGRQVTSRSPASVLREVQHLAASPGFRGTITDLGGPTANLFGMGCDSAAARRACRRPSCLHPARCPHFRVDHAPYRSLLAAAARVPGVRQVAVGSGLRLELAAEDPAFLRDLAARHVSGRLTVAPEHVDARVLAAMRKPGVETFERFRARFEEACAATGTRHLLVPYLVAAHPGSGPEEAIALALWLKERGIRPRQVQLFLPTPGTLSTAMYVTGRDPFTGDHLPVARDPRERARQRALLLWWKAEEQPAVREALRAWGREDLVGRGPGALVPPGPAVPGWRPRPEERRSRTPGPRRARRNG